VTSLQINNLEPDELRALIREELTAILGSRPDPRPMLSTPEVAKRLGFRSAAVARSLIENGELPGRLVGGVWRVPAAAVDQFCAANPNQLGPVSAPSTNTERDKLAGSFARASGGVL
jgi:excisionase family DNA binding protein